MNYEIYHSKQWEIARKLIISRANGLCEQCLAKGIYKPGLVVHHIEWLTNENKRDPFIAYGSDNLIYLCYDCHDSIHRPVLRDGLVFEDGELKQL